MNLRISQFPPEQAFAKGLQPNSLYHDESHSRAETDAKQLITDWADVPNAVANYCKFFNLSRDRTMYVWEQHAYTEYRTYEVTVRHTPSYTVEQVPSTN